MTDEVKSLLDAVSAGISSADPSTPAQTQVTGDETDGSDDEEANGAASDAVGAETVEADAAAADDTGAGDETDESGNAGKVPVPAKAKDGKEPAGAAELGADGKPKPAADPKAYKGDPVNDPPDNRWKEQTRNRFQALTTLVKDKDAQLVEADRLFDSIAHTGVQPDELAQMLQYAYARHKGTSAEKQAAYKFLKEELRAVALELGETDSVDFLADHPDLQEAIAANTITADFAKEVALARSRATHATTTAAASAAQTEAQQAHTAGVNAIGATATALAKRDGMAVFSAKKDILVAVLKPVLAQLPPAQWAAAFQKAYDAMPKPAAAIAPVIVPAKPPGQPLRPGTPAGGSGKKEAKSLLEAVSFAIDGNDD